MLLATVLCVPVERADVGRLRPVEVIEIVIDGEKVILQTDTNDYGEGSDAVSALQDMKSKSTGIIYLDTATFLLVGQEAQYEAERLRDYLKEKTELCQTIETVDLQIAAAYLSMHNDLPVMGKWKPGDAIPVLKMEGERLMLQGINGTKWG